MQAEPLRLARPGGLHNVMTWLSRHILSRVAGVQIYDEKQTELHGGDGLVTPQFFLDKVAHLSGFLHEDEG